MNSPEPVTLSRNAMATRFEIVLYGAEPSRLRAAGEEAMDEISSLDRQLSRFNPLSEISRINARAAQAAVKVEPRLFRLLQEAYEVWRDTDGAFDITIAPLMKAWGLGGGVGRVPSDRELAEAKLRTGMDLVELERDASVTFRRDGVELDLGAIGKGYAIDRAVETLRDSGVESALVHGGTSTIYAIGSMPNGRPWRIAIQDARPGVELADECQPLPDCVDLIDSSLSVSAVSGKSFAQNGREYGHVIDPRTGHPSFAASLTAVWGPSAARTDALSTALLVLGRPGVVLLRGRYSDYRCLAVVDKGTIAR